MNDEIKESLLEFDCHQEELVETSCHENQDNL